MAVFSDCPQRPYRGRNYFLICDMTQPDSRTKHGVCRHGISALAICVLLMVLASTGCSYVCYTRITTEKEYLKGDGIRYFDSSPYILVQRDTNSNWSSSILYLTDHTKPSEVHVGAFLAINNTTLTFSNAILTDVSAQTDSSAVPAAVIQAAAQAAAAMASTPMAHAAENELGTGGVTPPKEQVAPPITKPAAFLFKIIKQDGRWGVVGASAPEIDLIHFDTVQ
jgi:hypothetical protein